MFSLRHPDPSARLDHARQVLLTEASALTEVAGRLDQTFEQAVDLLYRCAGRVAVTGIGKSADVAQKVVGTLNSMGTRSYSLDATRALHGDLGMVHPNDVALIFSHSGESEEIVRLIGPLRQMSAAIIGITGNRAGTLARKSDVAILYGAIVESCPLALAPSTSTTVMMAIGDALAFVLSEMRQFTADDFARNHPAGSLGRKLATVQSSMRQGSDLRLAPATAPIREVFSKCRHQGRRTGAIILVNEWGEMAGLFTDSDLARLFESHQDSLFDRPISEAMNTNPICVGPNTRLSEALEILRTKKISELPVVDEQRRPIGLLDITDLIGLVPQEETNHLPTHTRDWLWERQSA